MKNNGQFFEAAYRDKQNKYLQADGALPILHAQDDSWSSWGKFGEGWENNGGGGNWGNANGGVESSPNTYIVKIVNACSSAISNVDIGDSANNRSVTAGADYGPFNSNTNITLSCPISDIGYGEFLASTETRPFTVGTTVIISTTAGQLDNTITITHRNVGGKRQDFVISPTLDRFQNQTDRILDETEYLFDSMTRMRFSSILGSATVTVRMYTKNVYSATQIIAGRGEQEFFSAPNFARS